MSDYDRIVLPATCHTHKGTAGFTNFCVSNVRNGIEFDAHAAGGCVVTLCEVAARRLHRALGEWL